MSNEERIAAWIETACRANAVPDIAEIIEVRWNRRFTRRFGDAGIRLDPFRARIRLSPLIWSRASEEERRETVMHETCHIVAWHQHGVAIKPHGSEWKQAMRNCGLKPTVYHKIALIGISQFPVRTCPKPEAERCFVSRRRLSRLLRGDMLHCITCGQRIGAAAIETECDDDC